MIKNINHFWGLALIKPLIFILSLLPLVWWGFGLAFNYLGANPIETVIRGSGEWALRFLLITLAISPLRRLLGWAKLMRLRRMLGLFSWFYASLHLLIYLSLDQFFDWTAIFYDILDRPFITVGMLAFLLLIPLGLTSNNASMRRLGKNWLRLHQLVYPLAISAVIHFWWLVKADLFEPIIYATILSLLLGERLYRKWQT
jgi:sulfoxide reductase heme-binding subunit YedZ